MIRILLVIVFALAVCEVGWSHDIYTGIYGKDSQLCCGSDDCSATVYREQNARYEFLTRENIWVQIPEDRITFLPIPGDDLTGDEHHAHLCYRVASETDKINRPENIFGPIYLYCAFIPPGSI